MIVKCPFEVLGCEGIIRRVEKTEHMNKTAEKHMEYSKNAIVCNQQELQDTKARLKKTEQELKETKLSMEQTKQELEGRLRAKEEEIEALKKYQEKQIKEVTDGSKEVVKQFKELTQQLEEKIDVLIKVQNCAIQKDPATWSLLLNMLATASKSGKQTLPVIIKMNQFQKKKNSGIKNDWWYSNGFYISEEGYKICLGVVANGYGIAAGSHVSAYIFLMKGEYDDKLQWPKQYSTLTIQLLNQLADNHHSKLLNCIFDGKAETKSSLRVTYAAISNWGISSSPKFMQHSELSSDHYQFLKDDCLYFRVC